MTEDEENPSVQKPTKSVLGIFKDPEPGFSTTVISVAANLILSNMFLYGVTGNARMSYLASIATVPISVFLCVRDQQNDYDRWREMRTMRMKGVPERFMPYKCKFDWTDFDQRKLKQDLANAQNLSGS